MVAATFTLYEIVCVCFFDSRRLVSQRLARVAETLEFRDRKTAGAYYGRKNFLDETHITLLIVSLFELILNVNSYFTNLI